jgi:hypothetical protein
LVLLQEKQEERCWQTDKTPGTPESREKDCMNFLQSEIRSKEKCAWICYFKKELSILHKFFEE